MSPLLQGTTNLPRRPVRYDLLSSCYSLDREQAIRKISRNLHTGGQFAMVALIRRPPITQLMGSKVKEEIDRDFFSLHPHREIRSAR